VASLVESLGSMFKEHVVQVQKTVEETVQKNLTPLLASMKIPTRREIAQVEASLDRLSRQVEQLAKAKAATKTTKKKAAIKKKATAKPTKKKAAAKTKKVKKVSGKAGKK